MSLNFTLALVIAKTTARAGAMPIPASRSVPPIQKTLSEIVVSARPTVTTARRRAIAHEPIGMCPKLSPPDRLPIAKRASTMPASNPPWPNVATTPASTAAHAPIKRNPTTVASSTGGLVRTLPILRRLRGMRTRPISGDMMNHAQPPSRITTISSIAVVVPACRATNVMTTGAKTQISSCSEASSENSGVSWRELTIFG